MADLLALAWLVESVLPVVQVERAADTRNNPVERADWTHPRMDWMYPVEWAADTRRKPARNPERMILAEHTADCNPVVAAADTRNNPVERAAVRDLLV